MRKLSDQTAFFCLSALTRPGFVKRFLAILILIFSLPLCLAHQTAQENNSSSTSRSHNGLSKAGVFWTINALFLYEPKFHDSKESLEFLNNVSKIRGDDVQILRFCWWMNEPQSLIRKELLRQWLGQMQYEKNLPPLDVVMAKVRPWIEPFYSKDSSDLTEFGRKVTPNVTWGSEKDNKHEENTYKVRCEEIRTVYVSLCRPGSNMLKKSDFFYVSSKYTLEPFIDKHQPLGSLLFSGDNEKIKAVFDPYCEEHRWGDPFHRDMFEETVGVYLLKHAKPGRN